ncbi:hypothetical protein BJX99DRAFT_121322 [Aspergillus californicus]
MMLRFIQKESHRNNQKKTSMPRRKSCHECSQCRFHCDRSQPLCQKCTARDIPCSGYGIRDRFREPSSHDKPGILEVIHEYVHRRQPGFDQYRP